MPKSTTETPRPEPTETPRPEPSKIYEMIEDFKKDIGETPQKKSKKDLAKDIESIKNSFVDPKLERLISFNYTQKLMGSDKSIIDIIDSQIGDREKEYMTTCELRDGIGAHLRSFTHTDGGRKLTKFTGSSKSPDGFEAKLDEFFIKHGVETAKAAEATRGRESDASSVSLPEDSRGRGGSASSAEPPKPDAAPAPAAPAASAGLAGAIRSLLGTKPPLTQNAPVDKPEITTLGFNPLYNKPVKLGKKESTEKGTGRS